jgi:hypothetical protein
MPTATIPRRMMASTGAVIFEGEEQGDGSWIFGGPIAFTGVITPQQPSLSADGLVVVFLGSDNTVFRPFIATRSDVMSSFGTPIPLADNPDGAGTESQPTFSQDCSHVFVSFDGSRVVDLF